MIGGNRFRKSILILALLFLSAASIVASGGGGGDSSTPVTITSFSPAGGVVGDTVTIMGTGFSTTAANNAVAFNGTAAVVTSCTSTEIVTTVPSGATTGPITVTVGGETATSASSFTVLPTLPAGFYSDGTKYIACYWSGTTRTDLPANGTNNAEAVSIAVSGGTVYTAGYYSDGTKEIPCYWTGTTRTDLAGDGTHDAAAVEIAVSGGTVYTAGFYSDGTKEIPCYWTGTTRTDLPGDGTHDAEVESGGGGGE